MIASNTLPRVSVVVPTYNSANHLEACLRSITNQDYPNLELVVVDNESADSTVTLAEEFTDLVFCKGPERSAQRNHGVANSTGDYVLIIDSDMELEPDVVSSLVERVGERPDLHALVVPERSFGDGFWVKCKALERSFYVGVAWMEASRFFPRATFDAFGGYDEENTGTEDYDLPQRIMHQHGPDAIGRTDRYINHNEMRLSFSRTVKKKFYYAQRLDSYTSKPANLDIFKKQANPLLRYRLFFSQPRRLLRRPLIGGGMLLLKTAELGAGALGVLVSKVKRTGRSSIYSPS